MERVQSTIFFSATLLPIRYYKEQLGGEKEDAAVYAKSVFLPEQRKVMIARDVTTKYTRRGAAEYEKIAAYIDGFISAKEGNYLFFFPSYRFMDEFVKRAGMKLLRDESVCIDQSFYLYGRPDAEKVGRGISRRKTPKELVNGMDLKKPVIVLDHEPRLLEELNKAGVDIAL